MNTTTIFYDGTCSFCTQWARRGEALGFRCEPLNDGRTAAVMKVRTAEGTELGGAEAIAHLCRQVWWLWPVWWVSRMPGIGRAGRWGYAVVASRRHCRRDGCKL